jgi:NADPH:quinone reductase-like Zn-dependent oxidoreductase
MNVENTVIGPHGRRRPVSGGRPQPRPDQAEVPVRAAAVDPFAAQTARPPSGPSRDAAGTVVPVGPGVARARRRAMVLGAGGAGERVAAGGPAAHVPRRPPLAEAASSLPAFAADG